MLQQRCDKVHSPVNLSHRLNKLAERRIPKKQNVATKAVDPTTLWIVNLTAKNERLVIHRPIKCRNTPLGTNSAHIFNMRSPVLILAVRRELPFMKIKCDELTVPANQTRTLTLAA